MQPVSRFRGRSAVLLAFALALLALTLAQVSVVTPAYAQAEATPTPADPLWRAFSAVRSALSQKYRVDLGIVQAYQWEQVEFVNGIDSCLDLDDPNSARGLYFGWRFLITSLSGNQYEGRSSFDTTIIAACDRVEADFNSVAAPAAAADPNLPAPVAGSAATGGFELGGHVLDLNGNTVSLMNRAGMTWVKKQLRYSLGMDAGVAAGMINAAHANGFKILLGIVGEPSQMGDFGGYVSSYSQFVGAVAGLGADAIEVWNEPNIDREWPAGQINGANYTQLLAPAYNAIKSANPNTLVISGAPAPTGYFGAAGCTGQGCNDDVFMQQMAQAGAGQYMDCVGLHYNEAIVGPNQASGDSRGSYPTYYFGSMTARGYGPFGGKPVCYTELGYLSPEGFSQPLPGAFGWAANTSVAEHAAWLAEAATIAATSGRVRLMIIWNVDFPMFTDTDPMGGYAMFRPDGSCPACDTLGAVMGR